MSTFIDSRDDKAEAWAIAGEYADLIRSAGFRGWLVRVRLMRTKQGRTYGIFAVSPH